MYNFLICPFTVQLVLNIIYVSINRPGNPKDAGVLPRALDVLFNSIQNRQWDGMNLKPKMFMDVTRLSADQELEERKTKDRILKLSCDDVSNDDW